MKNKLIKTAFIILFLLSIFLILGWYMLSLSFNDSTRYVYFKSLFSNELKITLKKNIFFIPSMKRNLAERDDFIKNQKKLYKQFVSNISENMKYFHINPAFSKKIQSKAYKLNFVSYPIPLPTQSDWGNKPTGYLDQTESKIILASGNGQFFFINKKNFLEEKIILNNIKSNIGEIIKDEDFFSPSEYGIRDLLILDDHVYISYAKKTGNIRDHCLNATILRSKFNLDYFNFSEFFSSEQCQDWPFKGHHVGGRISSFKENKILLSIGDFYKRELAQDNNLLHGKIISIDIDSKEYDILSMGHRNPQGLYYNKEKNIMISTDHGPKGGDEININFFNDKKNVVNYGWPISSYGEHYDDKYREDAPLHKSHVDFGFKEPIKHFSPSIAISEIIKIPMKNKSDNTNDFFVAAMGGGFGPVLPGWHQSIHHIRFNTDYSKVILEDIIPIDDRIRDIMLVKDTKMILLLLESMPGIGVLEITSY